MGRKGATAIYYASAKRKIAAGASSRAERCMPEVVARIPEGVVGRHRARARARNSLEIARKKRIRLNTAPSAPPRTNRESAGRRVEYSSRERSPFSSPSVFSGRRVSLLREVEYRRGRRGTSETTRPNENSKLRVRVF